MSAKWVGVYISNVYKNHIKKFDISEMNIKNTHTYIYVYKIHMHIYVYKNTHTHTHLTYVTTHFAYITTLINYIFMHIKKSSIKMVKFSWRWHKVLLAWDVIQVIDGKYLKTMPTIYPSRVSEILNGCANMNCKFITNMCLSILTLFKLLMMQDYVLSPRNCNQGSLSIDGLCGCWKSKNMPEQASVTRINVLWNV